MISKAQGEVHLLGQHCARSWGFGAVARGEGLTWYWKGDSVWGGSQHPTTGALRLIHERFCDEVVKTEEGEDGLETGHQAETSIVKDAPPQ